MHARLLFVKAELDALVDHYIHSGRDDLNDSVKLELLDARLKVQRVIYQLGRHTDAERHTMVEGCATRLSLSKGEQ